MLHYSVLLLAELLVPALVQVLELAPQQQAMEQVVEKVEEQQRQV